MLSPEAADITLRAKIIYEFLRDFCYLEKNIKQIFSDKIIETDLIDKNQLYFYLGKSAGQILINYEEESLFHHEHLKYKPTEKFKDFTLLQIIRMLEINTRKQQRQDTEMQHFPNNIDSFNTSAQIEFYGAIKRLINMRNKLAHELENLNFKNTTHCIEVLSDNILSNELGIQIDEKYDEDGQLRMIASNTVFIRKIEKELNNMYA